MSSPTSKAPSESPGHLSGDGEGHAPHADEGGAGPVLVRGALSQAVLAALRERNPGLTTIDRGAYLRLQVPGRCVLQRSAVERHLGAPFRLPADLEGIMPSFKGKLRMSEDEAVWEEPGTP
jgi:hypothetical protein